MAKVDIKAGGMSQKDLVDLLYQIVSSIKGVCAKLDDDGGVPLTTYEANCYTAKILTVIEDSKGNRTGVGGGKIISPTGITGEALIELLYEIFDAGATLLTQLDTDSLTDSDYLSSLYSSSFPYNVIKGNGSSLGNGGAGSYTFGPTAAPDDPHLIDLLYSLVNVIHLTAAKLDADGTVTDTTYDSLWYTANILTVIENSAGSTIGNAKTF